MIALLAFAAGYVFVKSEQPESEASTAPVATTTQVQIPAQVSTGSISEETAAYVIDAQFPKFGMPAIDAKIEKSVNETITEFKALPANPPEMASPQNELTVRYESPYVGSDVVSVRLIISEYTGGAHSNSVFSGLNFDKATSRQLLQSDAFKMIGLTAQQVSIAATAQLKEKLGDVFFAEGSDSNPENFSSFVISADTVTFIFQPYQVAAYAEGPQEVSFQRKH